MQTVLSEPKEIILQNGLNNYTGCHDSYIESENPYDVNHNLGDLGLHYEVYVGSWGGIIPNSARVALKFDLSPLPSQVTIIKAVLSLHAFDVFVGTDLKNGPKSLYRFTDHWTPDVLNWMNAPRYTAAPVAKNENSATKVWEEYDVTEIVK